jgi:hypothetical protein
MLGGCYDDGGETMSEINGLHYTCTDQCPVQTTSFGAERDSACVTKCDDVFEVQMKKLCKGGGDSFAMDLEEKYDILPGARVEPTQHSTLMSLMMPSSLAVLAALAMVVAGAVLVRRTHSQHRAVCDFELAPIIT